MKSYLLTPLLLVCHCFYAQSLIFKGGIDISKRQLYNPSMSQPGKTPTTVHWIAAENASLLYEYHFNDLFSITGGLGLTGRGYSSTMRIHYIGPNKTSTEEFELINRFHYIDLPLALKVRTQMGQGFYFYGYAGPYFGRTVAAKGTSWWGHADTTDLYIHTEKRKINLDKLNERRWDIGYSVGFGVEVNHIFLEGVYSAGLTTIGAIGISERSTNRIVMISVGYRLELNRELEPETIEDGELVD
jgi:hypothetical protein